MNKTKKRVLLQSLTPLDLEVACDHWLELERPVPDNWYANTPESRICYLKFLGGHQAEVLNRRLPHHVRSVRFWIIRRRPTYHQVTVYQADAIKHILNFLGVTAPSRYYVLVPMKPSKGERP